MAFGRMGRTGLIEVAAQATVNDGTAEAVTERVARRQRAAPMAQSNEREPKPIQGAAGADAGGFGDRGRQGPDSSA